MLLLLVVLHKALLPNLEIFPLGCQVYNRILLHCYWSRGLVSTLAHCPGRDTLVMAVHNVSGWSLVFVWLLVSIPPHFFSFPSLSLKYHLNLSRLERASFDSCLRCVSLRHRTYRFSSFMTSVIMSCLVSLVRPVQFHIAHLMLVYMATTLGVCLFPWSRFSRFPFLGLPIAGFL